MHRSSHIYAFLTVLLAGVSFFVPVSVHAQYVIEQIPGGDQVFGDFVVGPTKIELAIEPGTERTIELMVTNRMGEPRTFSFDIEDATGSENPEQTVVLLGDDRGPYSLRDYIRIPQDSFTLNQGERARIPVTVAIPHDAQPGGLYGSVLVTTASAAQEGDNMVRAGAQAGSVVVSRIGALFFVTVPGPIERKGALTGFDTIPGGAWFTEGPIRFQLLYQNEGSVHLNPYGIVSIKNMLGEEVGMITADPWFAMPQSLRMRELSWDRPYLMGWYTAEAKINRGYDNNIDTKSISFVVIPWKLALIVFVGLSMFFLLVRFVVRRFEIRRR